MEVKSVPAKRPQRQAARKAAIIIRKQARLTGDPANCWLVSEVIPEKLYISDAVAATDWDVIKRLGITHIVNADHKLTPNKFAKRKIKYLSIDIDDSKDQDIRQHFKKSNDFIAKGKVVLVHCAKGKSRSATLVISYLIASKHANTLKEAIEILSRVRECIAPNPGFMKQLQAEYGKSGR